MCLYHQVIMLMKFTTLDTLDYAISDELAFVLRIQIRRIIFDVFFLVLVLQIIVRSLRLITADGKVANSSTLPCSKTTLDGSARVKFIFVFILHRRTPQGFCSDSFGCWRIELWRQRPLCASNSIGMSTQCHFRLPYGVCLMCA
jgi:hypothetical protein